MKIAILDDQQLMIDAVINTVPKLVSYSIDFSQTYTSINELFQKGTNADIILWDIQLEREHSDKFIPKFTELFPNTKILIFTSGRHRYLYSVCQLKGVWGYFLKNDTDYEKAFSAINNGELYFSPKIRECIQSIIASPEKPIFFELTPKETEILNLSAKGLTSSEIAQFTNTSTRTVENHRANAMQKSGTNNLTQCVARAIARGLIHP